jgi:hypothetical protein
MARNAARQSIAQPATTFTTGNDPKGVGKGSFVIPLTKCGAALAAKIPAKRLRTRVCPHVVLRSSLVW